MKRIKKFIIKTNPVRNELTSGLLWELDLDGINEGKDNLIVYAEEKKEITKDDICEILESMKTEMLIEEYEISSEEFEDKNWNEEWEKNISVIKVTDKIVIKPTFKEYNASDDELIIHIDPKMSFGTGEHETTKLIITLLEEYVSKGIKVLDAGCGTAVLAIASLKLGAKSAVAFDTDEWCFINGNENKELNDIGDELDIRLCETKDINEKDFDLILANINKNVLNKIHNELYERCVKRGKIILSGLLFSDEEEITKLYTGLGLKLIDKKQMNEWIALVFEK